MISVFRIMSLCCVNVKTFIPLFTVEKVYKNHIVTSVFKPQQKKTPTFMVKIKKNTSELCFYYINQRLIEVIMIRTI